MNRPRFLHLITAFILITSLALTSTHLTAPSRVEASSGPQHEKQVRQAIPTANIQANTSPFVSEPVTPHLSRPVRELPTANQAIQPRDQAPRVDPQPGLIPENITDAVDGLARRSGVNAGRTPSPLLTFEGVGNLANLSPPDTNGDVGPNHYVQMVNIQFSIYDKSGTLLSGPTNFDVLFNGAGGNCEVNNDGDPVVLYDGMADRWLLSQFSTPNHMCIAISQTANPTGSYWLYEFNVGAFPDYFKFGVWPDGYYMSANESSYTAYAFDRVKMLAGQPATFQKFTGGTNFYLPSDLDGALQPPLGAPNYFYTFKDNSTHGGADRLEVYAFHVDWVTPANSTFTLAANIPITAYTYTVCGFFVLNCVPQAGTTQRVDAVSEWPMHRFPYRNFGTHETLLGNFTIDVGSDVSAIRWFELRKSGMGLWTLYQEGTFNPDSHHHFMGSIAMDGQGNIALGYSKSSATLNPAIRYTTRLAGDPLGTMQAEATLINGAGSQTGSNRWGDYSAMSIDPVDDCTFWYTNEYYPVSLGNAWHTRVGNFAIPDCLADLEIVKTPSSGIIAPGGSITYTLQVTNLGPSSLSTNTGITITDQIPSGMTGAVSNPGDWSCSQVGQNISCSRSGLNVGAAMPIVINAQAPVSIGLFTNTAAVDSAASDPNPANNSDSVTVSVTTVPLVNAGPDQITTEGAVVNLSGGYIDPDTQPAPEITWDFGGGFQITGVLTPSVIIFDDGLYTATLIITDTLGAVGQDFLEISVANVTPTLGMAAITQTIQSGQAVTLTGTVTDPGVLDTQTVTIDWAPGISQTINLPAGGGTFTANAIYTQVGNYPVTVTVTDKDGAADSQGGTITVLTPTSGRKLFLPMIIKNP